MLNATVKLCHWHPLAQQNVEGHLKLGFGFVPIPLRYALPYSVSVGWCVAFPYSVSMGWCVAFPYSVSTGWCVAFPNLYV
jgi:hypothetical protein